MPGQAKKRLELSSLADRSLCRLEYVKDAAWCVQGSELRRLLEARAWPCTQATLDAEEAMGGRYHRSSGRFGVYAAMRYLDDDSLWLKSEYQDYSPYPDPRAPDQLLVPLWFLDDPRLWLAADGTVFYGSHVDGDAPPYLTQAFEDVAHYWEITAMLEGFVVEGVPESSRARERCRLETTALVGDKIACELGLAAHSPGCRGATRAWVGPGAVAVELNLPGFKQGTDVLTEVEEGAVLATMTALGEGGCARLRPIDSLDDGLLASLPVHASHVHGAFTWGKWLDYPHPRYRRRYRESLLASGEMARK